jgi:hypothetical protein
MIDFLYGLFSGLLVAGSIVYSAREYFAVKTNDKMREDLQYADEEVKRLRAAMAKYVGTEGKWQI